jgi:hypothetical protein
LGPRPLWESLMKAAERNRRSTDWPRFSYHILHPRRAARGKKTVAMEWKCANIFFRNLPRTEVGSSKVKIAEHKRIHIAVLKWRLLTKMADQNGRPKWPTKMADQNGRPKWQCLPNLIETRSYFECLPRCKKMTNFPSTTKYLTFQV